jgi:hypothetical protein
VSRRDALFARAQGQTAKPALPLAPMLEQGKNPGRTRLKRLGKPAFPCPSPLIGQCFRFEAQHQVFQPMNATNNFLQGLGKGSLIFLINLLGSKTSLT